MNEAPARVRRLAEQLAHAANHARQVVASDMADAEREKCLTSDEIRKRELSMFARVSAEVEQCLQPGSAVEDLRFSRDELKAIVMHSDQNDIRKQARQLIAICNAELSERAKSKKAARPETA